MNWQPIGEMKRMSWSAISSFEYDPEQWYQQYYLGIKTDSKEMAFGRKIDERVQVDPKFIPTLRRYKHMQHRMEVIFDGIPLIGVADGFEELKRAALGDYKTGKKAWDQKRTDEAGQLTMYGLLLWLTIKLRPEKVDFYIHWLPTTETNDFRIEFRDRPVVPVTFKTQRTMRQLLEFGVRIKKTEAAMRKYVAERGRKVIPNGVR